MILSMSTDLTDLLVPMLELLGVERMGWGGVEGWGEGGGVGWRGLEGVG